MHDSVRAPTSDPEGRGVRVPLAPLFDRKSNPRPKQRRGSPAVPAAWSGGPQRQRLEDVPSLGLGRRTSPTLELASDVSRDHCRITVVEKPLLIVVDDFSMA